MDEKPAETAHVEPSAEPSVATIGDDDTLTPLHPNHVKILRILTVLLTLPFIVGSLVLEFTQVLPTGVFIIPVILAAAFLILRVPLRRYHARGFTMGADRLRVVRGLLFRSDSVVPFGRVQHIDVNQGPLERYYGLATLTLHTAGSHNASVHLPGLLNENALEMRETIRAHIKRETL
jgi:membrane protein YdbS with pleckstrin-like domain